MESLNGMNARNATPTVTMADGRDCVYTIFFYTLHLNDLAKSKQRKADSQPPKKSVISAHGF